MTEAYVHLFRGVIFEMDVSTLMSDAAPDRATRL